MMALRNMGSPNPQSNKLPGGLLSDFKNNIPTKEQLHFLNQQLSEALQEVLDGLDHTQKKAQTYLSGKQNEMYQLATSKSYNLPPQAKNEALGLWYDAKTKVTTLMSDLRGLITSKKV